MKLKTLLIITLVAIVFFILSCKQTPSCHEKMIALLKKAHKESNVLANQFYPDAALPYFDSLLTLAHSTPSQVRYCKYLKTKILLELGKEDEAVQVLEELTQEDEKNYVLELIWKDLALAYLRQGERTNCISNHTTESCILPVKGMGVHKDPTGSGKAINIYQNLLTKHPDDLESKWLLNLAYMTIGEYPQGVPSAFFIPGLEGDTTYRVNAFQDIAADLKLDVKNMAGGSIVEDFDNDGYLDLMTSSMDTEESIHYFENTADGTFSDLSSKVGLIGITGGLNMVQAGLQ